MDATKNGEKNVKCGKVPRERPRILPKDCMESLFDGGHDMDHGGCIAIRVARFTQATRACSADVAF